jgi:hypothetical protein
MIQLAPESTKKKKIPKNATVAITTEVVVNTSWREGQVTFFISTRTSCRNFPQRFGVSIRRAKNPGSPRSRSSRRPDSAASATVFTVALSSCRYRNLVAPPAHYAPLNLAGEEGIEPPHPVLETGGLPLNLLPCFVLPSGFPRTPTGTPLLHFAVHGVLPAGVAKFLGL